MKRQKETSKGLEMDLLGPITASTEAVFSNNDLIYNILLHVPARSLVRFKCVSKYWLGLISDQKFCYNHTTQNLEPVSALYFHLGSLGYDKLKSISLCGHKYLPSLSFLSGIESNRTIRVRDTRNGLTLCSYGWPEKYIVCNLTTRKYNIISQPTQRRSLCSLAYDPVVSPYYKIVSSGEISFGSYHINIYSSEKSSWTQFNDPELTDICIFSKAFFNGSVHWVNSDYYFRFKVDTEKLTKTLLPSDPQILEGYNTKFFGECGGNLLLVQYASRYEVGFRILQMEMETSRWILKQRVSLRTIPEAFPDKRIRFNLLTILNGSDEGDVILVLLIKGKVIAIYPNCKKFNTVCDTPDEFSRLKYLQWGGAYQHFESLAPV